MLSQYGMLWAFPERQNEREREREGGERGRGGQRERGKEEEGREEGGGGGRGRGRKKEQRGERGMLQAHSLKTETEAKNPTAT
jgi:hypothetical protein